MSSLAKLAGDIFVAAKAVEAYFESHGLPEPTFDNDLVASIPSSLQEHRSTLIDSTDRLKRLSSGVDDHADAILWTWADQLTLRAVYHYKIASAVPLEGSSSYASLAKATGLSEQLLQRFLRHCMSNYIFAQTPEGQVRHSAFSRRLATDSEFADGVGIQLYETGPASMFTLEALHRFGESGEHTDTGYALFNQAVNQEAGAGKPLQTAFEVLGQNPERGRRFGVAMQYYSKEPSRNISHLLAGYDWASIDRPDVELVDVGGGHGTVSKYLAQHTKELHFIVQDSADQVQTGEKLLPAELRTRVKFEAHDFLEPQQRQANVFLIRWVLHNWSDKYAVQILQRLVPAMRDGTRLILCEFLVDSEPDSSATKKRSR